MADPWNYLMRLLLFLWPSGPPIFHMYRLVDMVVVTVGEKVSYVSYALSNSK